jgi:hypothetical protein
MLVQVMMNLDIFYFYVVKFLTYESRFKTGSI